MQAVAIQTAVFRGYDLIAFACSTLEGRAIAHVDAASLPDEAAGALQFRQRRRNAGPPHAQDDRQHVVGHRNDPVIQPVGGKQQPAAQPFLEAVTSAAERGLGVLDQQRVDVTEQLLLDVRVSVRGPPELGHRDAQSIAGDRHQASIGSALYAEHRRHADKTEPSDHRDLDRTVALRSYQQRCDAAFDEVDVLDGMVVILKNRPALERNRLQERTEPLKGRRRKSGQQAVLDPNRLFPVGTAQRTFQRYPIELSSRCVPTRSCSAGIRTSSPPSYSLFDRESPASRQSGDAGQGVPFPSGIAVIPVPTTTRRSDRVQSAMLANPRLNDVQFR